MALAAFHLSMFSHQRVSCVDVIGDGKARRLPAAFGVTRLAITAILSLRELSGMRIVMAIQASCERHRSFEILRLVAVFADERCMFTEQRIVRTAVIESVVGAYLFPAAGDVTGCAVAAKGAAMNVLMARCAEFQQNGRPVLDGAIGRGRGSFVALSALKARM
jgi:hypothetical protein